MFINFYCPLIQFIPSSVQWGSLKENQLAGVCGKKVRNTFWVAHRTISTCSRKNNRSSLMERYLFYHLPHIQTVWTVKYIEACQCIVTKRVRLWRVRILLYNIICAHTWPNGFCANSPLRSPWKWSPAQPWTVSPSWNNSTRCHFGHFEGAHFRFHQRPHTVKGQTDSTFESPIVTCNKSWTVKYIGWQLVSQRPAANIQWEVHKVKCIIRGRLVIFFHIHKVTDH